MFGLGYQELLILLVIAAIYGPVLWLCSRILGKAGYPARWVLILLVPLVNVLMLWVFAFSTWPAEARTRDTGAPTQRTCPQCSAPYDLDDYRADAGAIYCSACRAQLPLPRSQLG